MSTISRLLHENHNPLFSQHRLDHCLRSFDQNKHRYLRDKESTHSNQQQNNLYKTKIKTIKESKHPIILQRNDPQSPTFGRVTNALPTAFHFFLRPRHYRRHDRTGRPTRLGQTRRGTGQWGQITKITVEDNVDVPLLKRKAGKKQISIRNRNTH